jgi:hemoglobin
MKGEINMPGENGRQEQKTLYQWLGGYDVIAAIIDDLFARLQQDSFFARFGMGRSMDSKRRTRQLVVDQICALAGGPCFYTGRDMKTAHEGLGITKAEWDINMQLTEAALDNLEIAEPERGELLSLFARYKGDIIDAPVHAAPKTGT